MTACHCAGFMRMARPSFVMPALFTSTSQPPKWSAVSLKRALISSTDAMSALTATASPPDALMASTTSSAGPSDAA